MNGCISARGRATAAILLVQGAAAICLFGMVPRAFGSSTPARPNILWITCEDMSADLGCYGDKEARTPNLDRLAREGTRFTHTYTAAPVCAPSRSCLITGMYATTIGTHHMRSSAVPPPYVKCFPEYLRAAGYYCTNNSKTDYNFDPPRTAWDENGKQAHWRNRPAGAPFFSVFNLNVTHESKFHLSDEEAAKLTRNLKPQDRHHPAKAKLPPYYPDTPVVRKDWARYYDMITVMDRQAGNLLAQLEADGLTSNTVVFFFSDHGRGLPRGKRWVYDSGIHVPLLVRWPGTLQPGSVREELVSFVDFAPTVLALAGVPAPKHFQGQAFLGSFAAPQPREYVFAARDRMDETYDIIRCVRDRQYKYIRNFEPHKPYAQRIEYGEKTPTMKELRRLHADGKLSGPQELFFRPTKPEEELYDLVSDPHELRNLAGSGEQEGRLRKMRSVLEEWQKSTGDLGLIPEGTLKERMRPGDVWQVTEPPAMSVDETSPSPRLILSSPTEGASIAFRTDTGSGPSPWRVYAHPVPLTVDSTTVTAVACRLGWKDSSEVQRQLSAKAGNP